MDSGGGARKPARDSRSASSAANAASRRRGAGNKAQGQDSGTTASNVGHGGAGGAPGGASRPKNLPQGVHWHTRRREFVVKRPVGKDWELIGYFAKLEDGLAAREALATQDDEESAADYDATMTLSNAAAATQAQAGDEGQRQAKKPAHGKHGVAWTKEEDERLEKMMAEKRPRWGELATQFEGRTRDALRCRAKALKKRRRSHGSGGGGGGGPGPGAGHGAGQDGSDKPQSETNGHSGVAPFPSPGDADKHGRGDSKVDSARDVAHVGERAGGGTASEPGANGATGKPVPAASSARVTKSKRKTAGIPPPKPNPVPSPGARSFAWTDEENETLRAAVTVHGQDWSSIHSLLPHRTLGAIQRRAVRLAELPAPAAAPRIESATVEQHTDDDSTSTDSATVPTYANWTKEEDATLLRLFKERGRQWKVMAAFFPGRSGAALRRRHNNLTGKRARLAGEPAQGAAGTGAAAEPADGSSETASDSDDIASDPTPSAEPVYRGDRGASAAGSQPPSKAPSQFVRQWSNAEDQLLLDQADRSEQVDWSVVGRLFPNRSEDSVRLRLRRLLKLRGDQGKTVATQPQRAPAPGPARSPRAPRSTAHLMMWTPEEENALILAVQKYGKDWKKVAQTMPLRTPKAVQKRVHRLLLALSKGDTADGRRLLPAGASMDDLRAAQAAMTNPPGDTPAAPSPETAPGTALTASEVAAPAAAAAVERAVKRSREDESGDESDGLDVEGYVVERDVGEDGIELPSTADKRAPAIGKARNRSKYAGVSWRAHRRKWLAVGVDQKYAGTFHDERLAAAMHDYELIKAGKEPVNGTSEADRAAAEKHRARHRGRGGKARKVQQAAAVAEWNAAAARAGVSEERALEAARAVLPGKWTPTYANVIRLLERSADVGVLNRILSVANPVDEGQEPAAKRARADDGRSGLKSMIARVGGVFSGVMAGHEAEISAVTQEEQYIKAARIVFGSEWQPKDGVPDITSEMGTAFLAALYAVVVSDFARSGGDGAAASDKDSTSGGARSAATGGGAGAGAGSSGL